MLKYVARKLLQMVLTLFIIATATFFLVNAIPGNALSSQLVNLPEKTRDNLYRQYGLDKPLLERYVIAMAGIPRGDFGESIIFPGQTVQSVIAEKLPVSAQLGVQQIVLGVIVGIVLGIIAAKKNGTVPDYLIVTLTTFLISVPPLIFALLLQNVFAGNLGLFPVIGWGSSSDFIANFKYTVLPTFAGCFIYIAFYARLMKTALLDVTNQDYILTAESKGIGKTRVLLKHTLRNSFIPIITYLPMTFATCITGSFFIERVFSIPGIALYFIEAVSQRDVSMVLGLTLFFAAFYLVIVFVTDILYKLVDPRIRIGSLEAEHA
jgi:oligopeptide transport system permease protein